MSCLQFTEPELEQRKKRIVYEKTNQMTKKQRYAHIHKHRMSHLPPPSGQIAKGTSTIFIGGQQVCTRQR